MELETINKNNHSSTEKHHIGIQDLQNMLPCEFGGKNTEHPVTGERCRSGFTIMNETRTKKDNKKRIQMLFLITLKIVLLFMNIKML